MSERQGIEIDYCSKCRGVWLDRGELDKIIEKNIGSAQSARPQEQQVQSREYNNHNEHNSHGNKNDYYGGHKKKGGLLGELFDF